MNVCVHSSTHVEGRGQLAEVDSLLPPSGSQGLIPGVRLGGESLHPLSHFTSLKIKLKWHPATSAFFHPVPGSFPSIAAGKVIVTETTYPVRPEICTVSPQGKVSQPLLDHMVIHRGIIHCLVGHQSFGLAHNKHCAAFLSAHHLGVQGPGQELGLQRQLLPGTPSGHSTPLLLSCASHYHSPLGLSLQLQASSVLPGCRVPGEMALPKSPSYPVPQGCSSSTDTVL